MPSTLDTQQLFSAGQDLHLIPIPHSLWPLGGLIILLSVLFAELCLILCNNETLLVVTAPCQATARAKGQLTDGAERDMPILGEVWQAQQCVMGFCGMKRCDDSSVCICVYTGM